MQSKTFKLFVSSTFSDFTKERRLLQKYVFPEIKEYCLAKGLTFQPIDLRWGVSNEAQLDQKTLELCLEEVKRSKLTPHPNFLIMIGNRYGWVPLPYMIEKTEFEQIILNTSIEEKELLREWYQLDENQLPVSYIIKERKKEYEKFEVWEYVEKKLRNILQNSIEKIDISEKEKNKYTKSATEQEVIEGIFKYLGKTPHQVQIEKNNIYSENNDFNHVYGYIRKVNSVDDEKYKESFIEDNPQLIEFIKTLKDSIKKGNLFEETADIVEISKDKTNASLKYSYEYIKGNENSPFVTDMIKYLKKSIDAIPITKLNDEVIVREEQKSFKEEMCAGFLGRKKALEKVEKYIASDSCQALIIYGRSGLGKSSFMAKAISETETKSTYRVIYRFIGVSSKLNTSIELMVSILNELGIQEKRKMKKTLSTDEEILESEDEFFTRVHKHLESIQDKTIIFIDAVDQIIKEDKFIWLPQTLSSSFKVVISVLDDPLYLAESKFFNNLRKRSTNLYELELFDDSKELLINILEKCNRTVTLDQVEYVLSKKDSGFPLYLTIAAEELKQWKSTDLLGNKEDEKNLVETQQEIIGEFINKLSRYHHDPKLIKKVFTYIFFLVGLSENEILDILSNDEELIKELASDQYFTNVSSEFPLVIWTRLYHQIKFLLKTININGSEVFKFFHKGVSSSVKPLVDKKQIGIELINVCKTTILIKSTSPYKSSRWGSIFIHLIKNYFTHVKEDDEIQVFEIQMLAEFISSVDVEWSYEFMNELGNIFNDCNYELQEKIVEYQGQNNTPDKFYDRKTVLKELIFNLFYQLNIKNKKNSALSFKVFNTPFEAALYKVIDIDFDVMVGSTLLERIEKEYEKYPEVYAFIYIKSKFHHRNQIMSNKPENFGEIETLSELLELYEKCILRKYKEIFFQKEFEELQKIYDGLRHYIENYDEIMAKQDEEINKLMDEVGYE